MGRCALYHLDHAGSDPDEVEYHDYGQIQADGWTQAGMGLGERGTFRIVVDHFCQEDNRCDPGDFVRYAWTVTRCPLLDTKQQKLIKSLE